ncbi:DUF721 domain-containing protein [Lishizhenia sp.]|uniref:DUF721 domain-containing protein n=1 Tax=Lishizhenia sp. TaxID=2497594 RepID=UPI00299D4681|nr:DUF721 domain-containing protein [Lishizhenia sp.]MDX1446450.1 DUF721 domain-containing protein [Lishizhenia sp.]
MSERGKGEVTLGDAINKLLKAYKLDDKMAEMTIIDAWEEMMGKAVANRTEKMVIKNEVLYLTLNSSVMRDELMHGKQVIIQRVNQRAGFEMIKDVWFG